MTFEEWRATKRQVPVDHEDIQAYPFREETRECLVYQGGLIIECCPGGGFILQLPMEEERTDDLEALELRLYEFGLGEGSIQA
jgi:hypothetical protein